MAKVIYSDGDVEEEILEILRNAVDLRSNISISPEKYGRWAIRYHLSELRGNIIRHLNFKGLDVLELGAGMGAVSRVIAENAASLDIVEGSQRRFDAASLRLRDLDNWQGCVANYQDYKTDKKYDVVCFFGVLEYAGRYIDAEDPFLWAITHAKSFLKSDGVLVVAIENKNGLKYFNGVSEDHLATKYSGICGYQVKRDIETFSYYELVNRMKATGLCDVVTHFPWPDYKLPKVVLSDTLYEMNQELASSIASTTKFEDYNCPDSKRLFPSALALNSIAKSDLLADMSNSFLSISTADKESKIKAKLLSRAAQGNEIGWVYSHGRIDNTQTVFVNNEGSIEVVKSFVGDKKFAKYDFFSVRRVEKAEVLKGIPVSMILLNHMYYKNWDDFDLLLKDFFESVFKRWSVEGADLLEPVALDAVPSNCHIVDGEYEFFDLEFCPNEVLGKSYLLLRTLLNIYYHNMDLFESCPSTNLEEVYIKLCSYFSVEPNLEQDVEKEVVFLNDVLLSKTTAQPHINNCRIPFIKPKKSSLVSLRSIKRMLRKKY